MIVEFLCRYQKEIKEDKLEEITNELNIQEIIQGNKFDRIKEKEKLVGKSNQYEYGPVLFDLSDIETANSVDKKHICLKFYSGMMRIVKIDYDNYKMIYQTMMGKVINSFTTGIKEKNDG